MSPDPGEKCGIITSTTNAISTAAIFSNKPGPPPWPSGVNSSLRPFGCRFYKSCPVSLTMPCRGCPGFRRACADRRVVPAPSLLLRSAMAEARTVSDPAGNAKLSKGSQGGRRVRARDDAAAAAILAVAVGVRQPTEPTRRSRYAGMVG